MSKAVPNNEDSSSRTSGAPGLIREVTAEGGVSAVRKQERQALAGSQAQEGGTVSGSQCAELLPLLELLHSMLREQWGASQSFQD
ncbi:hypothetical protein MHYP_G00337590 [Metynnis hypsauchen]